MARWFITVCCDFTILHIEEAFPTSIKNSAIGVYFAMGMLGGVIAPFIITLANEKSLSPVGVLGLMGFMAFALICMMKETLGLPLKEQIPEMERERRMSQTQSERKSEKFVDVFTDY